MSFEWKCGHCNKDIIVPYESPDKMSGYSTAFCSKCFKENLKTCEKTGEHYQAEDENGNLINCYVDICGVIFECKESLDNSNEGDINMKFLYVTMPDDSIWKVNAKLIADDRADYYSEFKKEDYDTIFKETMENSDVLIDWAENNMDWYGNVSRFASKVKGAEVDYEYGWRNGHKRIIHEGY